MVGRTYLCGNSREPYNRPPVKRVREDSEATRLRVFMHMPRQAPHASYRVVAVLADGSEALVCLALTRKEALERARQLRGDWPRGTVRLRLQQWSGPVSRGFWYDLPVFGDGLRLPRPRRLRGRRPADAAAEAGPLPPAAPGSN